MAAQRGLVCLQRLLVFSSLYFVHVSVKHIWMVFKKNGLFWLSWIFISKALGLQLCAWGSSTLFLEMSREESSSCCVPRLPCSVRDGEGTGQRRVRALVWRWTQQQPGQSLQQGWAVCSCTLESTRLPHRDHSSAEVLPLSGRGPEENKGFWNTQLDQRETPVGLGLVSLRGFDWKFFCVCCLAAGNWLLSLLPWGIGLTMAGSSTVVEIRRTQQ